jgi:heat shock protein HslJ
MSERTGAEPGDQLPWGTHWDLVRAAEPAVDWASVHATFGLQDGRAGGKAPVNRYFGTIEQGPDGALRLGPFGMTMMAGPPHAMAAEQAYLRLLEQVRGLRREGELLVLLDGHGVEVLAFAPSADPS